MTLNFIIWGSHRKWFYSGARLCVWKKCTCGIHPPVKPGKLTIRLLQCWGDLNPLHSTQKWTALILSPKSVSCLIFIICVISLSSQNVIFLFPWVIQHQLAVIKIISYNLLQMSFSIIIWLCFYLKTKDFSYKKKKVIEFDRISITSTVNYVNSFIYWKK